MGGLYLGRLTTLRSPVNSSTLALPKATLCLLALTTVLPTAAQSPRQQTGLEWCGVHFDDGQPLSVYDASTTGASLSMQRANPDETYKITILFFYTRQFADDFRDRAHMEDEIELSVDLLNLALDNSHVNARFRIVGIERHPAMPSQQQRAHAWILNDERAKSRRDELGADMVYALVDDPTGFGGQACQLFSFNASTSESCFWGSVNNWTPSVRPFDNENVWRTILRHEVGHNLGIQHSPEFGGNPNGGFYPGAVGYSSGPFSTNPEWYGTVMGGNYLPRFSTSSERFDFEKHKDLVVGEPGIHEASTALLHSIGPVSDYRPPAPPGVSVAAAQALESAGAVEFEVRLSSASDSVVTVDYATEDGGGAGGAVAGLDYTTTLGTLTFPIGTTATTNTTFMTTLRRDDRASDPGNAVLASERSEQRDLAGAATGTIRDDDFGPPMAVFAVGGAACDVDLCRAVTGETVRLVDTSSGTVRWRHWEFGDGQMSASRRAAHSWSSPGFYEVTLTVGDGMTESTASRRFLVEASSPAGSCVADAETLCLQDSRFSVALDWWTGDGRSGTGKVVHEGTNDSGLFYFFPPGDNWELLIKVLNGCGVNEHVWVYGASATTLGYLIRVTDTVTGKTKEYRNEPGRRAPAITDNKAFPESCDGVAAGRSSPAIELAAVPPAASESDGCTETSTTMCLQGGRYAVSVGWSKSNGEEGMAGVLRPRTDDSGLFYFFDPGNWEMLVKVLDGCGNNGRHWVFAASATDVGLDLMVRDTVTDLVRNYTKEPGEPARAVADVSAFPEGCQPQ